MVTVTFWRNAGPIPQMETESIYLGDEIRTKSAGQLEILDRGKVIKAYGTNRWVSAMVTN